MKVSPPWTCDQCGRPINSVEDGWVEWLQRQVTPEQWQSHSLRLVHFHTASPFHDAGGCQHNERAWFARDKSIIGDLPLSSFLGPDGLMTLLEFSSDRRFDFDVLIELIKRLHIPGYEQARNSFNSAISDGAFEPNTKPGFYSQSNIEDTLRWIREQNENR
ncbi:hypothetical protein GGR77_002679 [Xanthomonas translucens]